MNILFQSNQLSERGTETALIDYAVYNDKLLHNKSFFAFPQNNIYNKTRYFELEKKFDILLYSSINEIQNFVQINKIDLVYVINDGETHDIADDLLNVKTFVHCVFSTKRKHGTYYCCIHNFLNKFYKTKYPVLPHIITPLPNINHNLKDELHIPQNAIVFGSYCGERSFNIKKAHMAIINSAKKYPNMYFIFMNIYNFCKEDFNIELKNIIFLPGSTDLIQKTKFINTCTAMIHARSDGETFGLSIGEFSLRNKPIITYKPTPIETIKDYIHHILNKRPSYSTAHINNLGKIGFYYSTQKKLEKIIKKFYLNKISLTKKYDVFSEKFSPEKVMKIFDKIITN